MAGLGQGAVWSWGWGRVLGGEDLAGMPVDVHTHCVPKVIISRDSRMLKRLEQCLINHS